MKKENSLLNAVRQPSRGVNTASIFSPKAVIHGSIERNLIGLVDHVLRVVFAPLYSGCIIIVMFGLFLDFGYFASVRI